MRVLVLDGNQRSALAATRALGLSGAEVITADSRRPTLAGASRHASGSLTYPCPYTQPAAFREAVPALAHGAGVDVVLPMTEVTTYLVARHREDYEGIHLPLPAFDAFERLSDKGRLFREAEALGVPIPETRMVRDPAAAPELADALGYPVVLKPYRSRILEGDRWLAASVRIADNRQAVEAAIRDEPALSRHPFLLQAYVSGTGQGVFALYGKGEPLAFFAHRRLRERPPWGGVSVLSESVPVNPRMEAISRRLLGTVHWEGVAMVEFKVAPDGTPYLMEINPRFWGSLQLAIDAGVDFPTMACRQAMGVPVAPVSGYREGVRLRWLLGDLDHLYLLCRYGNSSWRDKGAACLRFLNPGLGSVHYEVNRWGDMRPFWRELRDYLRGG